MKKVLIFFPGLRVKNDEGAKHRLNSHINEYKSHGYDVIVLACCKDAFFGCNPKYLNMNAHWIIRPYILPFSRHIVLTRILNFYLNIVLALHTWFRKYDVVQMELQSNRSFLCRKGPIYITDIHGDSAYEVKEMKDNKQWFVDYLFNEQGRIASDSDLCIVVSEHLKQQIEINSKRDIKDYVIISCGVDIDRFQNAKNTTINGLDLRNRIVLGYCGGLQGWQNFDAMINLAIRLYKLDCRIFLLVLSNGNKEPYEKALHELGEENYYIKGLMPKDIPSYMKLMDAGLLLRSDLILNRVSSPTKICEYLAAGVPLICTRYSGDYSRSVKQGINGFVIDEPVPSDDEILKLLKWLKEVKNSRHIITEKCVESVKDRTFNAEFEGLVDKIDILRRISSTSTI